MVVDGTLVINASTTRRDIPASRVGGKGGIGRTSRRAYISFLRLNSVVEGRGFEERGKVYIYGFGNVPRKIPRGHRFRAGVGGNVRERKNGRKERMRSRYCCSYT